MPEEPQQKILLQVENLKTWFPIRSGIFSHTTGHVRAVDGVSITLHEGESLGLVGESGCGKTTLARSILGLDPVHAGTIHFAGENLRTLKGETLRAARRNLQIVFQDPFSSLNPRMTALDIVTEGLVEHGIIARRDREHSARTLLEDVGLDADALHRYPHEFSGGQRQRICVARAISFKPRLVICDEAVSALDVSVQAQIINLLLDLRNKYNLAYLFISHDLSVVRHICHRTAVMYLGKIIESGTSDDVIGNPHHPYTRALVSAIPRAGVPKRHRIVLSGEVPSPANPPAGCRFHPRCPYAQPKCGSNEPILDANVGGSRRVACIRKHEI
jgi:oligopeptide/dipeptide ABC transporter ATP-binding protein